MLDTIYNYSVRKKQISMVEKDINDLSIFFANADIIPKMM